MIYTGITKKIRLHDLRGSYIDTTLGNGLATKFAQTQAGHSKAGTTLDVYNKKNNAMTENAMEVLNETFSKRHEM